MNAINQPSVSLRRANFAYTYKTCLQQRVRSPAGKRDLHVRQSGHVQVGPLRFTS